MCMLSQYYSAGLGRSGTFMAIDMGIQQASYVPNQLCTYYIHVHHINTYMYMYIKLYIQTHQSVGDTLMYTV